MARCRPDPSIERQQINGFTFPLGVYPVEAMTPIEGYTLAFEPADEDEGEGDEGRRGERGEFGGREEFGEAGFGEGEGFGERSAFEREYEGPGGYGRAGYGGDEDDRSADEAFGAAGRGARDDEEDDDPNSAANAEKFEAIFGPGMGDDVEPWPDRYVFDIAIRATRLEPLFRQLMGLLPGRVYPILDVMGNDAYREIDPFLAYELVGMERFVDAVRRYREWFFEDGLVGFGAMSEQPFVYMFLDEHKILTVRVQVELKDAVERILKSFDLGEVEKIAGADAAVHEHRGVLDAPSNRPDLLTHDEIIEDLREQWGLELNINRDASTDDQGKLTGLVPWRCVVRVVDEKGDVRYVEVLLVAGAYSQAEELATAFVSRLIAYLGRKASGGKQVESGDEAKADADEEHPLADHISGGILALDLSKLTPEAMGAMFQGGESIDLSDLEDEWPDERVQILTADRIRPEDKERLKLVGFPEEMELTNPGVMVTRLVM